MTSQPGKQTFVTLILANISRTKGNPAMEFRQIIYKTFPLKNQTQNVVGKLFPGPFLKNQN